MRRLHHLQEQYQSQTRRAMYDVSQSTMKYTFKAPAMALLMFSLSSGQYQDYYRNGWLFLTYNDTIKPVPNLYFDLDRTYSNHHKIDLMQNQAGDKFWQVSIIQEPKKEKY